MLICKRYTATTRGEEPKQQTPGNAVLNFNHSTSEYFNVYSTQPWLTIMTRLIVFWGMIFRIQPVVESIEFTDCLNAVFRKLK